MQTACKERGDWQVALTDVITWSVLLPNWLVLLSALSGQSSHQNRAHPGPFRLVRLFLSLPALLGVAQNQYWFCSSSGSGSGSSSIKAASLEAQSNVKSPKPELSTVKIRHIRCQMERVTKLSLLRPHRAQHVVSHYSIHEPEWRNQTMDAERKGKITYLKSSRKPLQPTVAATTPKMLLQLAAQPVMKDAPLYLIGNDPNKSVFNL